MLVQKYLPITENVRFRTYTYYSYFDAIVSSPYRIGELAASVSVKGYDETIWKKEEKRLHVNSSKQADSLLFIAEKYNFSMEAFVYRKLLLNDEQTIEINYQQNSQPWGSIGLFVSNVVSFDSNYVHQIGRFCTGDIFYKNSGKQINYGNYGDGKCILRLKREEDSLMFYIYNSEKVEMELLQKQECIDKEFFLGVYVSLYNNNYYDWMFSNYFQLKANKKAEDVYLEFDGALKRDWKYFTTNYFIDYNILSISMIEKLSIDICDYVKENIKNNCYIEMDVDHFTIEGTKYYQSKCLKHTCLIYGFNDIKQLFFLICVDKNGHLKKGKISYMDLEKQTNEKNHLQSENENLIISEKYLPEKSNYCISEEDINKFSQAFLEGKSLVDARVVLPADGDYIYGIDIYDHFKKHNEIVIKDIRISHLLLEHKLCMLELVDFVKLKEMISVDTAEVLNGIAKESLETTKLLRNNILRNQIVPHKEFSLVVIKYLDRLKQLEVEFMSRLSGIY